MDTVEDLRVEALTLLPELSKDTFLLIFEESRPELIRIFEDYESTLYDCELCTGDIIVVQR
jgi:hypothetical protein